jgi:hypothetical protein
MSHRNKKPRQDGNPIGGVKIINRSNHTMKRIKSKWFSMEGYGYKKTKSLINRLSMWIIAIILATQASKILALFLK